MEPLAGHILVVGLGASGEAAAHYALAGAGAGCGAAVDVVDAADTPALRERASRLRAQGARVTLGTSEAEGSYDLAIVSPGVPPASELFRSAARASGEVVSEVEFAFRRSVSPWLAVTGTNGKTTTTSLLAHLLVSAGVSAYTVGNIGTPAIGIVAEAGPASALVAEVSSFQLALTSAFHPRVSVLLNITPDHLDWHGGLEAYAEDKARIFANQREGDVAVIDVDDPGSAAHVEPVRARGVRVACVSRTRREAGGAWVAADGTLTVDRPSGPLALVHRDELLIGGDHNVSNALAAAAAALAFGADPAAVRHGLRTFQPIEHRLEPVATVAGVEYFNDSKATNPDATVKALTAFDGRPVVVLLGGRNKDNSFAGLARAVRAADARPVVFGEAAEEIARYLAAEGVAFTMAATMTAAVPVATRIAGELPGSAVVLSPACASFDEFGGYAERGRVFKEHVAALARGEDSDGAA